MKLKLALFGALALIVTAGGQALARDEAPAAATEPAAQGLALDHVGFVVSDADKAVADAIADLKLGDAAKVSSWVITIDDGTYLGKPARFSADFRMLDLPNSKLEFITPLSGKSPYSDALAAGKDGVLHHLAFFVASIDETLSDLRKAHPGLRVVLDANLPGGVGRYAYVDGVIPGTLMELMQKGVPPAKADP